MISELPDEASWEDIQERIQFVAAVKKGLTDLENGRLVSHDQVKREAQQWLTGLNGQAQQSPTSEN